jgi:hypothetical protein
MRPDSFSRPLALAVLVALALVAAAGCGRNHFTTFMAPTGVSPAPAQWPGSVTGLVLFDPLNTPDLATAPFPPTRLELWQDTSRIAIDSLESGSAQFRFTNVKPGTYSVVGRSSTFLAGSLGNIRVGSGEKDGGNVKLIIDTNTLSSGMEVIGTIPGFRIADLQEGLFPIDVNQLYASQLGVWNYPSLDYPDGQVIPAGTYRFKFATIFPAVVTNMTGWGDAIGGTLTAPVTNHPAILGSGSSTDIVMTFPTTGVYAFTLDERRHTFSVQYQPARPALATRPARR